MKHPSKELVEKYAFGELDVTSRLLVEAHVDLCPECAGVVRAVQNQDSVLASLVPEKFEKATPLFRKIMERVATMPQPRSFALERHAVIPESVLAETPSPEAWSWTTMWPTKGKIATLLEDPVSGYALYAAFFTAGEVAPKHEHHYPEQTVMLQGGYSYDGKDVVRGDWDEAAPDTLHEPKVHGGEDCWCLVRSKIEGAFTFRGISAWREPFVRGMRLRRKWSGQ